VIKAGHARRGYAGDRYEIYRIKEKQKKRG
jgi:hypothetical protein